MRKRMSNSLFRRSLSGVHFGAGSYVQGHWVEGAPSIINLDASVQPTTPHDLLYLDIARRERKSYTIYTDYNNPGASLPTFSNGATAPAGTTVTYTTTQADTPYYLNFSNSAMHGNVNVTMEIEKFS